MVTISKKTVVIFTIIVMAVSILSSYTTHKKLERNKHLIEIINAYEQYYQATESYLDEISIDYNISFENDTEQNYYNARYKVDSLNLLN